MQNSPTSVPTSAILIGPRAACDLLEMQLALVGPQRGSARRAPVVLGRVQVGVESPRPEGLGVGGLSAPVLGVL